MAYDAALTLCYGTLFANDIGKLGLDVGDVRWLLKTGFVFGPAEAATRGCYRYRMEGATPNSGLRMVVAVVIPTGHTALKVKRVFWKDDVL